MTDVFFTFLLEDLLRKCAFAVKKKSRTVSTNRNNCRGCKQRRRETEVLTIEDGRKSAAPTRFD